MSAPCVIRKHFLFISHNVIYIHTLLLYYVVTVVIQKHDAHAYDVINMNIGKLINIFKIIFVSLCEYICM